MKVISKKLPFGNDLSVIQPTRRDTVAKFKDRVIELNVCLISDNSFTFSDNSFDVSTSNNGTKLPVELNIEKCFVLRKPSPGNGFVAETPRTSTPLSKDPISDSESSSSLQSSQGSSKKTRKSFVCDICKRKFFHQFYYKKHVLKHTATTRKKDTVTTRKKDTVTTRKKDTVTNVKKKINTDTFDCIYCGKTFSKKDSAYKHVKNVHMPGKMYTCDQCPKIYCTSSGLRDHRITRHEIELGLSCKGCGKIFASKKKISCHMESHPDHAGASG